MKKSLLILLLFSLIILVFSTGCESDSDADSTADGDQEVEGNVDAITSATPGVKDVMLTENHKGWKKAACLSCHNDPHKNGQKSGTCITCHGTNGATRRPEGHKNKNCMSCHEGDKYKQVHEKADFKDPLDCQTCHKYVENIECPFEEDVDAVVIGAGGGGLSAATMLAKAGQKVVLIEKHNKVGGYMSTFKRGDYTFEIALHAMGNLDKSKLGTPNSFETMGIWDKLKPIRLDPLYKTVTPDIEMVVPADPDEFMALLIKQFPHEKEGIERLFKDMHDSDEIYLQLMKAMADGPDALSEFSKTHAVELVKIYGYLEITLSDLLKEYFTDQKLHMIFTQLASYAGTEPDEIAAGFYLVMWFGYHFHGFYYFEGGSKSISEAMATEIQAHGGEIKLNTLATKIVVKDGQATQVQTKDDVCYNTKYVVSNANAPATMLNMVGEKELPAEYVTKLKNMDIGLSGLVLYIGVNKDYREQFEGAHEIFVNSSYDQHKNFEYGLMCNNDMAPILITNYNIADPSVSPEGKNVIVLAAELGYDCENQWHFYEDRQLYLDLKQEVTNTMLARAEKILPDLKKHIEVISIATPQTLENFTLNPKGSFFGFHNQPEQSMFNRLAQKTPIEGLFLAGAWTFPGPGQSAVISSGLSAAKLILQEIEDKNKPVDGDADQAETEVSENTEANEATEIENTEVNESTETGETK